MKVGSVVKHKDPTGLHCGSSVYPVAIVLCLDPFVLISESSDMIWYHQKQENLELIGRVSNKKVNWLKRKRPKWKLDSI